MPPQHGLLVKDEDDGCFLGDCDVAADDGEIRSPVVDGCRARERSLGREHLQAPLPKPLPQARLKRLDETQLGTARRPYGDVQCLSPLDITNRECRDHGERQRDREQR